MEQGGHGACLMRLSLSPFLLGAPSQRTARFIHPNYYSGCPRPYQYDVLKPQRIDLWFHFLIATSSTFEHDNALGKRSPTTRELSCRMLKTSAYAAQMCPVQKATKFLSATQIAKITDRYPEGPRLPLGSMNAKLNHMCNRHNQPLSPKLQKVELPKVTRKPETKEANR